MRNLNSKCGDFNWRFKGCLFTRWAIYEVSEQGTKPKIPTCLGGSRKKLGCVAETYTAIFFGPYLHFRFCRFYSGNGGWLSLPSLFNGLFPQLRCGWIWSKRSVSFAGDTRGSGFLQVKWNMMYLVWIASFEIKMHQPCITKGMRLLGITFNDLEAIPAYVNQKYITSFFAAIRSIHACYTIKVSFFVDSTCKMYGLHIRNHHARQGPI